MPTLATFIQHTIGTPGHNIKRKKKKKKSTHPNWKGKGKSVLVDDMILYIESP